MTTATPETVCKVSIVFESLLQCFLLPNENNVAVSNCPPELLSSHQILWPSLWSHMAYSEDSACPNRRHILCTVQHATKCTKIQSSWVRPAKKGWPLWNNTSRSCGPSFIVAGFTPKITSNMQNPQSSYLNFFFPPLYMFRGTKHLSFTIMHVSQTGFKIYLYFSVVCKLSTRCNTCGHCTEGKERERQRAVVP